MSKLDPHTSLREKLLASAFTVIRTQGYGATTVDDVCAAAGATKGAFFHHFRSKEDFAVQAAGHWSEVTQGFFANAPYRKLKDPLERVFGYIDFRLKILRGKTPEFTCLVGTMVQEVFETSSVIREACRRSIFDHAAELAKDIAEAKALYASKAKWSPESVALHSQAVIQGAFTLAKAGQSAELAAESINHLRRYLEFLFEPNGESSVRKR